MPKSSKLGFIVPVLILLATFFLFPLWLSNEQIVKGFCRTCTLPLTVAGFAFAYFWKIISCTFYVFFVQYSFTRVIYDFKTVKIYSPFFTKQLNIKDIKSMHSFTSQRALKYCITSNKGQKLEFGYLLVGRKFFLSLLENLLVVNPSIELSESIVSKFGSEIKTYLRQESLRSS
jgi:hypothetical protein